MDIVERVARALYCFHENVPVCPQNEAHVNWWFGLGEGESDYNPEVREEYMNAARTAIKAMKYDDADEGVLIDVSNAKHIEIITLAEAWDDMIEGHLNG